MDDFLDSFGATPQAVNLDDLVQVTPLADNTPPTASIRNRAAQAAILAPDPDKVIDNYQLMSHEMSNGSSATFDAVKSNIMSQNDQMDMQTTLKILGDPNVSIDQKKAVVSNLKQSSFLKDTGVILHANALSQASPGENAEQEDSRLSSVDAIREIYDARTQVQGLANAYKSAQTEVGNLKANLTEDRGLNTKAVNSVVDVLGAYLTPLGNNITTNKIAKDVGGRTTWQAIKDFVLPGTATSNLRDKIMSIPPEKRVAFSQDLIGAIKKDNSVIFGNDNQYTAFDKTSQLFDKGGYSSSSEFLDNVSSILDIVGLGGLARGAKNATKAAKGATAVEAAASVDGDFLRGGDSTVNGARRVGSSASDIQDVDFKTVPKTETNSVPNSQQTLSTPIDDGSAARLSEVSKLQDEKASLLGRAGNLSANGDIREMRSQISDLRNKIPDSSDEALKVRTKDLQQSQNLKFKDAQKLASKQITDETEDINSRIDRLQNQIDTNTNSAQATQRVSEIDKRISVLQKQGIDSPGNRTTISSSVKNLTYNENVQSQAQRIELNSVVRDEQPAAPAMIMQQANPDKARGGHEAAFHSDSEEMAQALYGTDKMHAMTGDNIPQILDPASEAVTSKVQDIDRYLRRAEAPDASVVEFVDNTGAIYYTPKEKAAARANVVNDFENATGMTLNPAMSSFDLTGGKVNINAVYGTAEGGFLKSDDAIQQAKFALRRYGVQDSDLQLLAKNGLDHIPVDPATTRNVDGNYMIRVKTSHEYDPTDIGRMENLDVKRNLFDRVSWTVSEHGGSASRYMLDAASMLHPTITGSAVVATDRSAALSRKLLEGANDFAKQFMSLPKNRRNALDEYIKEANFREIDFDPVHMASQGYDAKEISTIKSWRDFWDGHYYLENNDVIRSLKSQGFGLIDHNNARLFAKEIPKNSNIGKVYDVGTDKIVNLDKAQLDTLYNSGGSYAQLRRPVTLHGEQVEHVMIRNNASEYVRGLRPTDVALNYRKGYYQLKYTAPKYVEQIMKDASGKETGRKVVAVAGNTKEADFFAARMNSTTGESYNVRGDTRALKADMDQNWDLQASSGRISQRHRGKLLEDSSGANHLGDGEYIRNPVDSAIAGANSISQRTMTRPMIEAAKARFLQQFEDALPKRAGQTRWPLSVKDIGEKGKLSSKLSADARTTYEYINYLENGYINGVDEAYKGLMNMTANMLGNAHITTGERFFNAMSHTSPTSIGKNTAFMAYIAMNPIRQWIVQPHQVVRTMIYNPIGWASGSIEKDLIEYLGDAMKVNGGSTSKRGSDFIKFVNDSGMLDAVDKHNLVRGALMDMKGSSDFIGKGIGKTVDFSRKVGFDAGEQGNLMGHLAAVFDKHIRNGENLSDPAKRDLAYSETRALSYDMNFAGDMPYNQTSTGLVLQFMQMPHKAIAQYTNRRMDGAMRLRLAGADLLLWGTPAAFIGSVLGTDILPKDKDMRDTFLHGLESVVYNKFFSSISGERVNIDFSGLAPADMTGWSDFFKAMYTGGVDKMVMNSPGGQLFFKNAGEGGRIQTAVKSMARYFGAVEDIDETPQTFVSVMNDVAKISSGYSNAVKAKILLDGGKRLDAYGIAVGDRASQMEAWAQALGFGSGDTRDLYEMTKQLSGDVKSHKDQVLNVYNETKRYYAEQLQLEATDPKYITKVTGRMLLVFKDDVDAQQIIMQQLKSDLNGKEQSLLNLFMKRSMIPNAGNLRDQVNQMPVPDDQKQMMLQRIDDVQKYTQPLTAQKKEKQNR